MIGIFQAVTKNFLNIIQKISIAKFLIIWFGD